MKRIWIMNPASQNSNNSAGQKGRLTNQDIFPVASDDEISQMSSAEQGREGRNPGNSRSSRTFSSGCTDLVHELANTTTAVLMSAQVLGWKLPPYSRLKRPLQQIERNAQRSGELSRRLLSRLEADISDQPSAVCSSMEIFGVGSSNAVTAQEPGVDSGSAVNLPPRMNSHPVPVFSPAREDELTSPCDGCTSMFPKKG